MFKFYRSVLSAGIVALGLAACGDVVQNTTVVLPDTTSHHDTTSASKGIVVSPHSATIIVTGTVQLSASVSAKWSSANASTASVSSTGMVTGVAAGLARIIGTSVADPTKSDTALVTVNAVQAAVGTIDSIKMQLSSYQGRKGDVLSPTVEVYTTGVISNNFRCGSDNPAIVTGDTVRMSDGVHGLFKLVGVSPVVTINPPADTVRTRTQVWCETLEAHTFPGGSQDRLRAGAEIVVKP